MRSNLSFSCLLRPSAFVGAVFLLSVFGSFPAVSAADEDDELIDIEGEPEPPASSSKATQKKADEPDDELIIIDDDDDDDELLIIVDDTTLEDESPQLVQGALGRLWEAFHVGVQWRLHLSGQAAPLQDAPFRSRGDVNIESWLLPAPNLSIYANAFARIGLDASNNDVMWVPQVDFNEVYAKVNFGVGSVLIGRLVVPWGRTQVAAFGERLNPSDLRRGPHFPGAGQGLQPQWGAVAKTSLGNLSVEGVLFATHEPSEGSLAAPDQGGYRTGRYQQALFRRPLLDENGTRLLDREALIQSLPVQESITLGLRIWRRVGDFDLGASAVWGVDDTPGLDLQSTTGLLLASQFQSTGSSSTRVEACITEKEGCLPAESLRLQRTASLVLHAEWGLGLVILRTAFLAQPKISNLVPALAPGKTVYLKSDRGIQSTQLSHYGAVIAAEAGLFDWVTGSLELFDRIYADVPRGARLIGIELLDADDTSRRWVNRLALGASLKGSFFEQSLLWRLHGESGVLQPDVSGSLEVRYRLPLLDLYIGGRGNLFVGMPGSPGWMRQNSSSIDVFIGQGRQ
ncbi:MAG: hypothetical protein GY822_22605 [Deltaproteobacteria bacterium]|nr:hypothetical protein [Deltaproteobacteria bacterium]